MTIDKSVSSDGGFNLTCATDNTGYINVSPINNAGPVTYTWSGDGGTGNSRTNLPAGSYRVILTDANNCTADSVITLTAPDSLKIQYTVKLPFCPAQKDGEISLTVSGGVPGSNYSYIWPDKSTDKNLANISVGDYKVTVSDNNGCSIQETIQVVPLYETCLVIPNAISPNGDQINDVWIIGHIEEYPQAEVKIFNNWGEIVWKSERGYGHPWDGRSNGIMLPVDSYFYTIDLHNGSKLIAGSITIIK
jgi:gliding motility-associated-like protein